MVHNKRFVMALQKSEIDSYTDHQEKYLREATQNFRGIEKPLKYGPTIKTLQDLITALHREFSTDLVNIEIVNHIMLSYKSCPKEWQKFAKFDRFKYTRNLVDEGNGRFNLMLLCWGEGHGSAIHDHSESHCFMKVLKGDLKETRYKMPSVTDRESAASNGIDIGSNKSGTNECDDGELDGGELQETRQSILSFNEVAYINDNIGLHRVENPSYTDTAVSLHLYCPPFNSCSVFHKNTGKKMKCRTTFWSKYGVRQSSPNPE